MQLGIVEVNNRFEVFGILAGLNLAGRLELLLYFLYLIFDLGNCLFDGFAAFLYKFLNQWILLLISYRTPLADVMLKLFLSKALDPLVFLLISSPLGDFELDFAFIPV